MPAGSRMLFGVSLAEVVGLLRDVVRSFGDQGAQFTTSNLTSVLFSSPSSQWPPDRRLPHLVNPWCHCEARPCCTCTVFSKGACTAFRCGLSASIV